MLGWQVYFETNTVLYSDILASRKSLTDVARKWMRGEINVRGIYYLIDLIRLLNCLYKETLQYEPSVEKNDNSAAESDYFLMRLN